MIDYIAVDEEFKQYLSSNTDNLLLAFTDSSYRNVVNKTINHNRDLALIGDALLCLSISRIMYERGDKDITVPKQDYESDKTLVTVIGKYYQIKRKMLFDRNDKNLNNGYKWFKKSERQKYIATAMEAILGAYYYDNECSLDKVMVIVHLWMRIVDDSKKIADVNGDAK